MKTIYIIGFMGSGKTTVGRSLSEALGYKVIDTDNEIEKAMEKSISQLFEEDGEQAFRLLESNMIKQLPIKDIIITTGGGMILRSENRKWMKENGVVVYLEASYAEILKRLEGDQTRPLLFEDKQERVKKILEERLPLYRESAQITINTIGKSLNEVVMEVIERLNQL